MIRLTRIKQYITGRKPKPRGYHPAPGKPATTEVVVGVQKLPLGSPQLTAINEAARQIQLAAITPAQLIDAARGMNAAQRAEYRALLTLIADAQTEQRVRQYTDVCRED